MITIVWDVDDVLNPLMKNWFEHEWLPSHPSCSLGYMQLKRNPPHALLGISEKEYLDSLDRFRLSPAGRALKPVPEVMEWFHKHGATFSHVALTARPIETVPSLASWVMEHFGRWIRCFGFVPSRREGEHLHQYHAAKSDWLRWIRTGDILVEDNMENIAAAEKLGLKAVLIPQPWNESGTTLAESLGKLATTAADLTNRHR